MQRRFLCTPVTSVALVSIAAVGSRLAAITGPINVWSSLHLLLNNYDFIFILKAAASMTVLTTA